VFAKFPAFIAFGELANNVLKIKYTTPFSLILSSIIGNRLETSFPINSQDNELILSIFFLKFYKYVFYLKVDLFIIKGNYEEPPTEPENSIPEHTGT